MPQMAPLNWLMLYFYFIICILLINFYIYSYYSPNFFTYNFKKNNMNWKW